MRLNFIQGVCLTVLLMLILACAPPPPRYFKQTITSAPDKATIYFSRNPDQFDRALGITPYYGSSTHWSQGYYKAEKKGFIPQKKAVNGGYQNMDLFFQLEPLPQLPAPPKAIYPDPESVAIKPLSLDVSSAVEEFKVGPAAKIATMTFKQHEGTGAGALVADSLILNLQKKGYNVIDREMIENVLREQNIIGEGKTNLSDLEVSKKIGQLFHADYFISGAITEYTAQSQNISLSPSILPDEIERYKADHANYLNIFRVNEIEPTHIPKSIQEWEMEYASKPKSSYISLAKVGITLKIVDIKTSRIVWVGIAQTSDLRLQDGMKRIVEGMIKEFATKAKPAGPPAIKQ